MSCVTASLQWRGLLGTLDQASAVPRSCQARTGWSQYLGMRRLPQIGRRELGGHYRAHTVAQASRASGRRQAEVRSAAPLGYLIDQAVRGHDQVVPELGLVRGV